jgi:hypothetical protein
MWLSQTYHHFLCRKQSDWSPSEGNAAPALTERAQIEMKWLRRTMGDFTAQSGAGREHIRM